VLKGPAVYQPRGQSTADDLVYPNERSLFAIGLVVSLPVWLLLVVGTLGLAFVYALLFFVFYLFAQSGLIAHLKGTGVRISPQQFPDLHQRLTTCCAKLGIDPVPEAYLLHGDGAFNAFATRFLGRDFVVLLSDVVDALENRPGAIDFYLGHELGHVHRRHLLWSPVLLPANVLPLIGAAYHRAREATCDNYGAACCEDPEDAVVGLSALAAGGKRWKSLAVTEYAAQTAETGGFWMSFHELVSDYPWLVKRVERLAARAQGRPPSLPSRHPLAYLFALFVPRLGMGAGGGIGTMLLVVAVIGVVAAIAIPSLLRARVSANEAATIGDLRTVISAQAAYASAAGSYGYLQCLAEPSAPGCIANYSPDAPTFLDRELATLGTKSGYVRSFVPGAAAPTPSNPNGLDGYCISAVPAQPDQTGVRSFAGDGSGRICFDPGAADLCSNGSLPLDCAVLR